MGVTGFFRYTTLGIDSDVDDAPFVYYRYWRIRWPGDGSFRVGGGAFRYQRAPNKPLEPFDLGGRFFLPPRNEPAPSVWNLLGFRYINRTWDDERTRTDASAPKPWEAWISVPCLLPAALFALPPLALPRPRKRRAKIPQ